VGFKLVFLTPSVDCKDATICPASHGGTPPDGCLKRCNFLHKRHYTSVSFSQGRPVTTHNIQLHPLAARPNPFYLPHVYMLLF
jgi:hypothetical protein